MQHDCPATVVGGRRRNVFNEVVFRRERVEARTRVDRDRVGSANPTYLRHHAGGLTINPHVQFLIRQLVTLEILSELPNVAVEVLYAVEMEGLYNRGPVVPYRVEGDNPRSPGPHEDVGKTLISPLVFGIAIRTHEAVENLARGQRQFRPVLGQHLFYLADYDNRLRLRAPRGETLWAFRPVGSVFAASRKQLREGSFTPGFVSLHFRPSPLLHLFPLQPRAAHGVHALELPDPATHLFT